jgi:hypothetical protein
MNVGGGLHFDVLPMDVFDESETLIENTLIADNVGGRNAYNDTCSSVGTLCASSVCFMFLASQQYYPAIVQSRWWRHSAWIAFSENASYFFPFCFLFLLLLLLCDSLIRCSEM